MAGPPLLKNCCLCATLEQGTVIIGVLTLLLCLAVLILIGVGGFVANDFINEYKDTCQEHFEEKPKKKLMELMHLFVSEMNCPTAAPSHAHAETMHQLKHNMLNTMKSEINKNPDFENAFDVCEDILDEVSAFLVTTVAIIIICGMVVLYVATSFLFLGVWLKNPMFVMPWVMSASLTDFGLSLGCCAAIGMYERWTAAIERFSEYYDLTWTIPVITAGIFSTASACGVYIYFIIAVASYAYELSLSDEEYGDETDDRSQQSNQRW